MLAKDALLRVANGDRELILPTTIVASAEFRTNARRAPWERRAGALNNVRGDYELGLTLMLLSTSFTPATLRAKSAAWRFCSELSTNPLNCTVPLKVVTLTSG